MLLLLQHIAEAMEPDRITSRNQFRLCSDWVEDRVLLLCGGKFRLMRQLLLLICEGLLIVMMVYVMIWERLLL